MRKEEWKDEVRERVQHRREKRSVQPELPLFVAGREADNLAAPSAAEHERSPGVAGQDPEAQKGSRRGSEDDALADLPIRAGGADGVTTEEAWGESGTAEPPNDGFVADEWQMGDELEVPARPTERPARTGERVSAGLIDLAFLLALWGSVVFFTRQVGRVRLEGLLPAWPYLVAYLAFLGLAYAAYFTGTTGQTLGKIVLGLRVVDTAGRPPAAWRAFLRAALGCIGILALFAGFIPSIFDPARRALHDRLLRTRVIRG
jgi:uncharacterized RDD family membrane protein YckC